MHLWNTFSGYRLQSNSRTSNYNVRNSHSPATNLLGKATLELKLSIELDMPGEGMSAGWVMLKRTVASEKATVLLLMEPLSLRDRLMPEFFQRSYAFCDSSSSSSSKLTPTVAVSSLRGMMHGNTITSTSTVPPKASSSPNIQIPPRRPPLFTPQTTLPLLPEPPAPKPPLPPRPGTRPISSIGGNSVTLNTTTSSTSSSHSTISNPLASSRESTFHPRTWAYTLTGTAACVGYGFVDGFNTESLTVNTIS
ncbi:hypothetical protein D9756_002765 [Leucocoprinus leucothites]|uniref:Uncharacterized protein n=1 Tax=Leucocoprinus leucothites TaxID=201217 RepID=A0A8H5GBQ6_9AGAR|nr:hypothetical protein D9756_002765 [Leucoagaricus leucothites]